VTLRRLGRYELRTRLGKGGEGEVWDAVLHGPAGFRRRVALKLLREARADDDRELLVREARLGALVHHPNVVSTLELGVEDGRWFLVMDRVDGLTTRQLAKERRLPAAVLLDIGRQAAAGLQHIHDLTDDDGIPLGLVHRDIKPTNLMVDRYGAVRIVDLGIAKLAGADDLAAGTPGYMAPEQLHGNEGPTADVFGLGATLAKLALGTSPLGRGVRALAALEDVDDVILGGTLEADLDAVLPGLGAVIVRAMRHDPTERFPSADAFARALMALFPAVPEMVTLAGIMGAPMASASPSPLAPGRRTPTARLVGRVRERGALREQVDADEVPLVVVRGPAGCGKTHLVRDTLQDRSPTWASLREVHDAEGLLRALSHAAGTGVGDDLQAAAEVLAQQDGLWVLDAADEGMDAVGALLRAWLPLGAGPMVVVTSRRRVPGVDGVELQVGPLPTDDAVELLRSEGGPGDEAEMRRIVRAVDRLPLAVRLLGVQARRDGYAATARAVAAEATLDPVVRGLEASAGGLGDDARKALVDLSVLVGAFDADAVVAVVAPDVAEAVSALAELVDHSLVSARQGRFRMLRPVRVWAGRRDGVRRAAAEVRHGRWRAGMGRRLIDVGVGLRPSEALSALPDLQAALVRARDRGDQDTHALVALVVALGLWATGVRTESLRLLEEAVPGEGVLRRHLLIQLCDRLMAFGRVELALQRIDALVHGSVGLDRLHGLRIRGRILGKLGRYDEGRSDLEEAADGLLAVGDPSFAWTYFSIGELERRRGAYEAALPWLQRAMDAAARVSPVRVERIRYDVAVTLVLLERFHEAVGPMEQSLLDLEAVGRVAMAAAARANLAELLQALGRHAASRAHAAEAVVEGKAVGIAQITVHARSLLVDDALLQGELGPDDPELVALVDDADAGDANLRCHVALLEALAARSIGDASRADAARARVDTWVEQAFPVVQARVLLYDAHHLPIADARRRVDETSAPGLPYSRALHTLARATVAMRAGKRGMARGALLEADLTIAQLQLGPGALVCVELDRLRHRLLG